MMNFIAQSMRRFGLAPKNKNDIVAQAPAAAPSTANPLAHLEIGSKWSYSTLEYPLDIQGRSDLGHYMMFYINVPTTSPSGQKTVAANRAEAGGAVAGVAPNLGIGGKNGVKVPKPDSAIQGILSQTEYSNKVNGGKGMMGGGGSSWTPGSQDAVVARQHHQGTTSNVLGQSRTMRTKDSIILYMPPQIIENYNAQWKEGELGRIAGEGKDVAKSAMDLFRSSEAEKANDDGEKTDLMKTVKAQMKMLGDEARQKAASTFGQAGGGDLAAMMNKADNQAINNFLEVMFTGIGHRKFSYTWKFAPKSAKESEVCFNIIRKFKMHMAPELGGKGHGRFFVVPSEFDLFYMFRGEENEWMNKISSCVLINLDVNYTPNQYQTFRPHKNRKGAPPVEMDLKLDFMETQLITKELVAQGF